MLAAASLLAGHAAVEGAKTRVRRVNRQFTIQDCGTPLAVLRLVGTSPKCLAVAPDGQLVGVGQFYGSVFRFGPATGRSEKIGIAPGSVYDILPLEDRTYFCGYVAFMAEYDHSRPYEINRKASFEEDTNPKRYRTTGKWTRCMLRGPDGCGWLFVDEALCRIHPDGTLETVRDAMEYRGKMVWQGKTLYIYNGGRVYSRLFANVVRIPDLFR
ncbi:MAG: hypothetical protein ACE5JM_10510 [Armatimonadota bacterium]